MIVVSLSVTEKVRILYDILFEIATCVLIFIYCESMVKWRIDDAVSECIWLFELGNCYYGHYWVGYSRLTWSY
jgi:hypothetical protein